MWAISIPCEICNDGCGKEQGPCYNGLDWNWILDSFFAGWNSTLFLHFQEDYCLFFFKMIVIYAKEALKSPMSTGKYFVWMKLQGLDVFPSNIMDIINTRRIFHYNEYCFVNNAVEIAPPIINIIPIWPSNITDIVRNQCRDIVSTDYRYNLCRNVYCLLWFSRWHDDQI